MALTAPQIIDRDARGIAGPGLTRDDVMTASEVAELLGLPVSTVYYLPGRGEIPACRLGEGGGSSVPGSKRCWTRERAQ
jgi:excisionase family DNA binding protein